MNRRTIALAASAALTVAGALVWVACESPLSPSYQLDSARVLAIQSNPVDMLPDGSVTLQALLYLPPGSPKPTYQWSWCAAVGSTLQCAVTAQQLTSILDPDGSLGVDIDYSLGSGSQAVFDYPVNPSILQAACVRVLVEAGVEDASDEEDEAATTTTPSTTADSGVPPGANGRIACNGSSWTVDVLLTVGVGSVNLQAVRTLTLYLTPPASTNHNPTVLGLAPFTSPAPGAGPLGNPALQADGAVVDPGVGTAGDAGLVVAAQIPVAASELYGVGPLSDPDASDAEAPPCAADASVSSNPFDFGDADCVPQVYESLDLAWYVQGGLLEHATTSMPSVRLGQPQAWGPLLVNQWAPPAPEGTTPIVLVVRDNRGGIGWTSVPAQVPVK